MSYRLDVTQRTPIASWILDDTSPFQEHTGNGYAAATKSGSGAPTAAAALVSNADFASVFNNTQIGEFTSPLFVQGKESQTFALEAWVLVVPKTTSASQQILSHDAQQDGLTINGTVLKFSTKYLTATEAACTYDLQITRAVHVVGIHNKYSNELWVDGELVASVALTDAQIADSFITTNGKLYAGASTSNQEIALNGVAIYTSISPESIKKNFIAGRRAVPQEKIVTQYDGASYSLDADYGSIYLYKTWAVKDDFKSSLVNNVNVLENTVEPVYVSNLTTAGSWTCAVPLDINSGTSIYGILAEWSGSNITVQASTDGTTWTTLTNGALVGGLGSPYNPTGKDLQIKVSFAAGLTDAYLESLSVTGFLNNTFQSPELKTITATYPSVLRGDYEPIEYRDDNGVNLHGGTLTLGVDASGAPNVARTLEVWIKTLSGAPTISVTGTKYINGLASAAALPIGQWVLLHLVSGADITTAVTITGDCIIGRVTLYPTALSASDVALIYDCYTGVPVLHVDDTGNITMSEPAAPVSIYTHVWEINAGG